MLTLVATLVVLSVLILVHEFGHFFAAKSVDIEVPRFSLGLGPKVVGFKRGETEYVLSALPLGGYVKMAGMEEGNELEGGAAAAPRAPGPRDFDAKPLWARAWVVSAGVIMNFLFALVLFTLLGVVYGERVDPTTRLAIRAEPPLAGAAAPLAQVPFGAELRAVGEREVGSWDEIQRALIEAPAGPLTLRFANAPAVTLALPADDSARLALLTRLEPLHEPVIGQIASGTPAERAGLQPGDRVRRAAGRPVRTWSDFEAAIRAHPGRPLALQIERDRRVLDVSVAPAAERELDAELKRIEVGRLGVYARVDVEHREVGLGEAARRGAQLTWANSVGIVRFLGDLLTGDASPRGLGGPLAIGQLSGQAARFGLESFLNFMALLSINLAILNLLPIPILDGGHLMFMTLEALRGRPLSVEQRVRLSHAGLIIVVGIMVWAMANDVLRFFGI